MRKQWKTLKKNYYTRKLNKSINKKIKMDGLNIVNRLYQVNGNNRLFRDKTKIKNAKYQAQLAKQLYREIGKPNAMNFVLTANSFRNRASYILNTDSYFTYEDLKIDRQVKTIVDNYVRALALRGQTWTWPEIYDRYSANLNTMLPDNDAVDQLREQFVANSILNPAFYPSHIIINPTVAAVNWGWIFRINPAILRFDCAMYAFYNFILNFIPLTYFIRWVPIMSAAGGTLSVADSVEHFIRYRRYRVLVAKALIQIFTSEVADERLKPVPVPLDTLQATNLENDVAISRVLTVMKSVLGLAAINQNAVGGLNWHAQLLFQNGIGNNVNLKAAFDARYVAHAAGREALQVGQNAYAIFEGLMDKMISSILLHSSDACYFFLFVFDMYAYTLSKLANPEQGIDKPYNVIGDFMVANKYVAGRGVDDQYMSDQYCYTYSDLVSNEFIKVYPCNMMVGKDWKIKSRKSNSLVFYVPNDDVKQTVNFTISINCSLYSFKKFILETADSRRYESLSPNLKSYIKKMLPNIERYFIVKDANSKIVREKIERMLNTVNRKD